MSLLSSEFPLLNCSVCSPEGSPPPVYRIFNLVVIGLLLPLIALFGLISNSLSVYVFTRPPMRSSVNNYLSALAVSDFLVVATAIFLFTVEGLRHYVGVWFAIIYARGTPLVFPIGTIAQTCSVYFTIAAAIDCFLLLVCGRKIHESCCGLTSSKGVVCGIIIGSLFYNATHFLEVERIVCWDNRRGEISEEICPTAFRLDPEYFLYYYTFGYTIFMAIGPLGLLILLNCIIMAKLLWKKRKSKITNKHNRDSIQNVPSQEPEENPITLVLVVALFIMCNSMALIVNIIEGSMGEQLGTTLNYLVDLSNMLVVVNSSANFLIYYAFDPKFRQTLRRICGCCCGSTKRTLSHNRRSESGGILIQNGNGNGIVLESSPSLDQTIFSSNHPNFFPLRNLMSTEV